MQVFEYITVPAPRKGQAAKGIKGVPAKFANAVTVLINEMAAEGWEYQRSDTLPCEERQGLTGKTVKYHALLVFRRAVTTEDEDETLIALPKPEDEIEVEIDASEEISEPEETPPLEDTPEMTDATPDLPKDKTD